MSSTAPAQNIVTADNFGPAVNILNWFLTVTTVLAVTARVLTKLNYLRFGSDDIAILLALVENFLPMQYSFLANSNYQVFSIGLCVAASYQELNGLGQHQYSLSPDELGNYQKVILLEAAMIHLLIKQGCLRGRHSFHLNSAFLEVVRCDLPS